MDLPSMRIEPIDSDHSWPQQSVPSRNASFVIPSIESVLAGDFFKIQNIDYFNLIYAWINNDTYYILLVVISSIIQQNN